MARKKRWSEEDDAKLFTLFRKGTRGGINPKLQTAKDIHKIIDRHFGGEEVTPYENFAPLFRRRARAWLLEQELSGARKKKSASSKAKKTSSEGEGEESEEEDKDYADSNEEDEELGDLDEADEVSEEEEEAMPPRRNTRKPKATEVSVTTTSGCSG